LPAGSIGSKYGCRSIVRNRLRHVRGGAPASSESPQANMASLAATRTRSIADMTRVLAKWARDCKAVVRSGEVWLVDQWLGVDTQSLLTPEHLREDHISVNGDGYWYEAIAYSSLWQYIRWLRPSHSDVVYEIGCGMGRAMCLFVRYPIRGCVGIELRSDLAEKARQNLQGLRGRVAPFEIRNEDASEADYRDGTIYFLFNPFGRATLEAVLVQIRRSILAQPRKIRVLYVNPVYEDVLARCGWLKFECSRRMIGYRSGASYWCHTPSHWRGS
jgi:SAM-dependent methyltransferase